MDRRETGSETRGVTSPGDSQRQLQAGLESVQQLLSLATQQQGTAHTTLQRLEVPQQLTKVVRCVDERADVCTRERGVDRKIDL